MLRGESNHLTSKAVADWLIKEEPNLVKKIYDYYFKTDISVSFDSEENTKRLEKVSEIISKNAPEIYKKLSRGEKLIIYIMKSGFGWIVYEDIEATLKIIAKIFHYEYQELAEALDLLFKKYLVFKYERLKNYSFIFSPPVFLRNIDYLILKEEIFEEEDSPQISKDLLSHQLIPLIAGLISYIITYAPRSSENNEIHKIDLGKMLDFFKDFSEKDYLEQIIKKLTRFGFFQKFNNRIIINKSLFDSIVNLSINEQLFIIFLYEFMDKFDFRKSAFMTLKILANYSFTKKTSMPLRELFFHYLNNEIYISLKNETKNLKLLLQQEELKFMFFVKSLETENIAIIQREYPDVISIATDSIIMNEPHASLLNNVDFSTHFKEEKFIVEANYEVIVEPLLRPDILFRLSLIAEPVTIQTISIFRITKESIYRSFAYGIRKEEILEFLTSHSKHPLPEIVKEGIKSFINSLTLEKMEHYKIIQVSAHFSSIIKDNFKNQIIEVEPHTFLIFDREVLKNVEEFCKKGKIAIRYITDFLGEKYSASLIQNLFSHNIKHLHTMKDFFDYYGNEPSGVNLKIDSEF